MMANQGPNIEIDVAQINNFINKQKRLLRKLVKFSLLLVIPLIILSTFFVYIKPYELGIKRKKIALIGEKGIQDNVLTTGFHFVIPFMDKIDKFPRGIQVVQLTKFNSNHQNLDNVTLHPAAHIQTYDGYFVDVDLSVFYHIVDPLKVIRKLGVKGVYENAIIPKIVPALKQTLGRLTTEEFYNSTLRVHQMEKARELLTSEFSEKGLEVDQVLVRYFIYSPEIQKNIEEKKLKDQLVFKNQAEAKAAKEGAKLKKVTQEGEANVAVILEEGQAYVTKKNAERDAYIRVQKAEADLLIKLAEAEKTRLKNEALQSGGSDKMVGLEMAKVLQGVNTIVLPSDGEHGLNPLNLKETLSTFEVK